MSRRREGMSSAELVKRHARKGSRNKKEALKEQMALDIETVIDGSFLFVHHPTVFLPLCEAQRASIGTSCKNTSCVKITLQELFQLQRKDLIPCRCTCKWARAIVSSCDECNQGLLCVVGRGRTHVKPGRTYQLRQR